MSNGLGFGSSWRANIKMKRQIRPLLASVILIGFCSIILCKRYLLSAWNGAFKLPGDFSVYFLANQRLKQGLVPYVIQDGSPYKYSPSILGLIGFLPDDSVRAWLVFGGVSLFFWILVILLLAGFKTWSDFLKLFLGLLLSWKGVLEAFDYGQMEFVIWLLAVVGARLFLVSRFWSGVLLGFLPAFKLPWAILAVPFLAQQGALVFLAGYGIAWVLWIAVIPFSIFGIDRAFHLTQAWIEILRVQPHELYLSDINQSFLGMALRLFTSAGDRRDVLALACTFIISGWGLGFMIRRSDRTHLRNPTPWLIFTQLVNPLAWRWGSVFALGAPFSAHVVRPIHWRTWSLWIGIAVLWALQQNPVVQSLGLSHWTDLHSYSLITLYWLGLLFL